MSPSLGEEDKRDKQRVSVCVLCGPGFVRLVLYLTATYLGKEFTGSAILSYLLVN